MAPGFNLIAAWSHNLDPIGLPEDTKSVNFSVMS
ncbi:subtilisin-like serine protease, partial [Trifolium medium]|nr:subtilisin-like serine protease [Trifolium medium]